MNVTPTPAQEQAALDWLSLLHDEPSSGDQATFSRWLRADPAHIQAYARAQVLWELSEVPARALADARTGARIDLHSTRTKHTLIHPLSQSHTHAGTHTRARSHAHVHAYT